MQKLSGSFRHELALLLWHKLRPRFTACGVCVGTCRLTRHKEHAMHWQTHSCVNTPARWQAAEIVGACRTLLLT